MTPKTKYHCPVCDHPYDTPEEAAACYKPPSRFRPGDIVWDGYNSNVFKVIDIPDSGLEGATVERVKELIVAGSLYHLEKKRCFLIGGFWCKAEKYPVAEAKKLVKTLERRLQAARAFLEMCEKNVINNSEIVALEGAEAS